MQEDHLAPWEGHDLFNDSALFEEHHHEEHQRPAETKIVAAVEDKPQSVRERPKRKQFNYQSLSLPKRQKRFLSVLPKVYDKLHHEAQFIVVRRQSKRVDIFHPHPPVFKNELTIQVPSEQQLLPKVHPDHPIRHSKPTKPFSDNPHPPKYQQQQLSHMMKRIRKNSVDLDHQQQHFLKKLSTYEQQIIKKCSLKTLEVFQRREKTQVAARRPKNNHGGQVEKHILDRILTRLE